MSNDNTSKSNQSLDVATILALGLTREEFADFSKDKPEKIKDYIEINPEMVVVKIKNTGVLLNIEQVKEFPVKKGEYLIMRMTNFIKLHEKKDMVIPTPFFKKYYNTYRGEDLNNKSLLCWVYGAGMGDMLFQQTIIRHLKIKYPRMFFTFAVPSHYIEFVESWGCVDRVIPNTFSISHFLNADYHLNMEFIIRSKKGFEENVYKCFAERASLNNLSFHEAYPAIPSNPEKQRYWKKILEKKKIKDFIIVQFTSANQMRNPRFQTRLNILNKILEKLNQKIVFIDHPSKNDEANKLIKHSKSPKQCFNFTKKSDSLVTSAALFSLASLVISVDTGAIHLAAALGIPCYGIYGPFNGYIRLATYPNCKWIDSKLDCAPCLEHDLVECINSKKGHPVCYDEYNVDTMVNEALTLLINK